MWSLIREPVSEIQRKADGETPGVKITVQGQDVCDAEHYFDVDEFERDINEAEQAVDGSVSLT